MVKQQIGLIGATSLVGDCIISQVEANNSQVLAFSRKAVTQSCGEVIWQQLPKLPASDTRKIEHWLYLAPIWTLPEHFQLLENYGARRVVALSSTSRFTKTDSSDTAEHAIARRLLEGEELFKAWAGGKNIEWIIIRPTLIYGHGKDKNIAEIASFIAKFGFFPLFGKATGLRQPIHAQDVADACIAALATPHAANRAYNISGGETLAYRDMVARIFTALNRPLHLVSVPLPIFRIAVSVLRRLPRYRHWSVAMAERMNRDLVFDHSDAVSDLAFKPRMFALPADDAAVKHARND